MSHPLAECASEKAPTPVGTSPCLSADPFGSDVQETSPLSPLSGDGSKDLSSWGNWQGS